MSSALRILILSLFFAALVGCTKGGNGSNNLDVINDADGDTIGDLGTDATVDVAADVAADVATDVSHLDAGDIDVAKDAADVPVDAPSDGDMDDSGPPVLPACRLLFEQDRGVVDTEVLRIARNNACVCGGMMLQNSPVVTAQSTGGSRVFVPYGWGVAEFELDAAGQLGTAGGLSPMLAAATGTVNCGTPWTLAGDHGAGRCQTVSLPMQVAPSGRLGLVQMPGERSVIGDFGFFVTLADRPLSPVHFIGPECGLLFPGGIMNYTGQREAEYSSNVSNLALMGVVADPSIGSPCPVVADCESLCTGSQSFAKAAFDQSPNDARGRFFVDSLGHDHWVAVVDNSLVIVDLTAQTPLYAIDPWWVDTQITFSATGAMTAARPPGGVLQPAALDSLRPTIALGPTSTDHTVFVLVGAQLLAIDLGDDGSQPTISGTVTGSPLVPADPWVPISLSGPWTVDGHRYATQLVGTAAGLSLELWNVEPDHAALVGSASLGTGNTLRSMRALETSRGVFFVIAGSAWSPTVEVLSLTGWARTGDVEAARRPIVDGPLSASPVSCTAERCYRVDTVGNDYAGAAIPFAAGDRLHFLGVPSGCGVDAALQYSCPRRNDYNLAYVCDP